MVTEASNNGSQPRRFIVGADDLPPTIVAPFAGDGDVEVSIQFSGRTGRQVVQIQTEDHAEFEVRVNGRTLATVRQGVTEVPASPNG